MVVHWLVRLWDSYDSRLSPDRRDGNTIETTGVELTQPRQAIATKALKELWWGVIRPLSFHALGQFDGMGQFLRCTVKGDVRCPSTPGEFHRALPLHIERMSLACTSITAVGQELMSDGVGSDRALPWTWAAACKAVKSFPCFSTWVGEVDPLYRLDPSLLKFSIKAGCELLRLEVSIYTTLSKQECIVALVAFTVPSGNVILYCG